MSDLIGLFHHHEEEGGVVVGRTVAVEGLLESFAQHSVHHSYAVHVDSRELPRVAPRLPSGRVSLHDRRELATPTRRFAGWHDSQFDTRLPFLARSKQRAAYPITLTHHTLSYKELLHDQLLRLLLAAPRPYDSVVCTSRAAQRALATCLDSVAERLRSQFGPALGYRGRYDVIPLGVDCQRFRPMERDVARAQFAIPSDAFVMLWVGRLSLIDKADLLPVLDALAELTARHPERNLLLVCAGSERPGERFGAAISAHARELGLADRVRTMRSEEFSSPERLYGAADVFLSPVDNIQESFGLTPVEAMACGVPQIVSDWDGYRETVVHGETGFLLPTRWARCADDLSDQAWLNESSFDHLALAQSVAVDMSALVQAVSRLISDAQLAASMAEASRRRAVAELSWQAVVPRFEALWQELAGLARAAGAPPPESPAHDEPDYDAAFGHYASQRLDDDAAFVLTARGRGLASGKGKLALFYNDAWKYLDVEMLRRILGGFLAMHERGQGLSLGRIVAVLGQKEGPSARARTVRHVLWLLKYGFIDVA